MKYKPTKDEELNALLVQLQEAEQTKADTQRQIDAMTAGINVLMEAFNEDAQTANTRPFTVNWITDKEKRDENRNKSGLIVRKTSSTGTIDFSGLIPTFDYLEDVYFGDKEKYEYFANIDNAQTFMDLREELLEMGQKITELRKSLKLAKTNCIRIRSKATVRASMLGLDELFEEVYCKMV